MEEKKSKKKKLTLSISSKKSFITPQYTHSKNKKSVLIEKKPASRWGEKKFQPRGTNFNKPKPTRDSIPKKFPINRNSDIRKLAEERATKRFKSSKMRLLSQKD